MTYDPNPRYPLAGGEVGRGFGALADSDRRTARPRALAIDGPAALSWAGFLTGLVDELGRREVSAELVDARRFLASWEEVQRRTAASVLPGDPVFGRVFEGSLVVLFDRLPPDANTADNADVRVVFGPGSALFEHDLLWYVDLPKWQSLAAVRKADAGNLGQPVGEAGSEQRLLFVDWPVLERHKQELLPRLDHYVDLSEPDTPRSLDGETLRRTLRQLAGGPFRTRPTFLPGPWGGQWLSDALGISTDAPNLAWSYELITPESGVLLGTDDPVEVGFELLMAAEGERVLGTELKARFGVSFPVRFDYLDTMGGGHLSIQCHPSEEYMRETFGLPYTQHETYYVVDTSPGAEIFLGLREDADLEAFRAEAERAEDPGLELEPERYLQTHPAVQHRLYLIPAGTAHASGAGNIVLEISATPYLYTLRFYDWLRRDLGGELRPVHLDHAFSNLDPSRSGESVRRELVPEPKPVRQGAGLVRARARQASRPLLRRAPTRLRGGHGGRHEWPISCAQPRRRRADRDRVRGGRRARALVRRDDRHPCVRRPIPVAARPGRPVQGRQGLGSVNAGEVVGALDIGGTHVAAGRVDVAAAAVDPGSRIFEPLPTAGGRVELVAVLARVTRSIAQPDLSSLGVAVPGPFDYEKGVSEMTHKLVGLHGIDLRSELRAAAALPDSTTIRFLNDAEAFLLGEWWAGAARGHVRVVGVTLGTGIGSAFGEDGRIVRSGSRVPPGGALHRLLFRGAPVEQTISRAALLAAYGTGVDDAVDVEHLADRALAGDVPARDVFADLGTALGRFLLPWLRTFEPSCLVVGGSIARSWVLFQDSLRAELESIPALGTVTAAEQLEDAALLGAARYASQQP